MKKSWNYVMGIDVSKKTFDVALGADQVKATHQLACFANKLNGYDDLEEWLEQQEISYSQLLICLENTGIYHRRLVDYLQSKGAVVWVESGLQIKRSGGIQRGKTDAIDAQRIQHYACRFQDRLVEYQPRGKELQQVADLMSLRARFQNSLKSFKMPIKELRKMGMIEQADCLEQSCQETIEAMKKNLKELDKKILKIIRSEEQLNECYRLTTSVKGVGFVTATNLLVYTNCFNRFDSAKQLAAYAGVAPYQHQSGTSIHRKTRVHHMANKTLKTNLHLAALSAVQHDPELKDYYWRKTEKEGKNKMLVLNNVRNKLVARIFSCVKNKRFYTPNYSPKTKVS